MAWLVRLEAAAEEAVPPHDPQVARLGGRMLGRRRHIVGVRPSFRPIGEKFTKLEVVEPGQRQVKAVGRRPLGWRW